MAALAYQAIFRIPVAELFPGLYETIAQGIEEKLLALEGTLENSSARRSKANITAIKLIWLNSRKSASITVSTE
jgi:hypothetical protein